MYLTSIEEKMLDGEFGRTISKNMEIIVALGDIYGAEGLIPVTSAQVSGVSYKTIGEAGLEYLEDLAQEKIETNVPSTLNPAGVDLDNWEALGFSEEFSVKQDRIVKAYSDLGVASTCTCTPYLIGNVPRVGDHIAWSESSAVAYGNSVLGARTNREGGPGALAAAICGRTANYGYHLEENREANLVVSVESNLETIDYGALGYLVGKQVGDGIPYFTLENKKNTIRNGNLKTLGAALASSGAVALYHIEDITPEAAKQNITGIEKINITRKDLDNTIENLTTSTKDYPDLVCLGCPHASLEEIEEIANIVKNKTIQNELWVCTSIGVKAAADRMNYTNIIESAGGHIVTDTCMVVAPIEDLGFEVIGVNSAKAANYVPGMCGLEVIYNDIEKLIKIEK